VDVVDEVDDVDDVEDVDEVEDSSDDSVAEQSVDISVSSSEDDVEDVEDVEDVDDVDDVDDVEDVELLLEDDEQSALCILRMTNTSMSPSMTLPSMLTSAASSIGVVISTFTLVSLELGSDRVTVYTNPVFSRRSSANVSASAAAILSNA
jgi:hypothetical protein